MDLHENPENNTMTALFELPGLNKENVNITVQNNRLEVTGESKMAQQYEEGGWAMRERQSGRFFRSITLPTGVTVRIPGQGIWFVG
jgi:HSP20 family protein